MLESDLPPPPSISKKGHPKKPSTIILLPITTTENVNPFQIVSVLHTAVIGTLTTLKVTLTSCRKPAIARIIHDEYKEMF